MKLGFIGMGNMAQALAAGFIRSGLISGAETTSYAPNQEKLAGNAERIGFVPAASLAALAERSDILVVACKPYQIEAVLAELGERLSGKALVSIAAGWPHERYKKYVGGDVRVQCVMPNTPVMVGKGVVLFEKDHSLLPDERAELVKLFSSVGTVEELPSHLMEVGAAVAGCGPAFADLFIEAYADAAVRYGIPRDTAYRLVSGMMLGAAALQMETGEHPGVLKDKVCSPAGTTICGVAALEAKGFRAACLASVDAVMAKKV